MTRDPLDRDYTPLALASTCADTVLRWGWDTPQWPEVSTLEPSSGGGSFLDALTSRGITPATCDLDPGARRGADHFEGDFLDYPSDRRFDLVIGNPPFGVAQEHVTKALDLLRPHGILAFVLPLAFGVHKAEWWATHCPSLVYMITPRPEFRVDGADMREVALHVWLRDELTMGRTSIRHLRWEKPPRAVARAQRAEQHGQMPLAPIVDPRQTSIFDAIQGDP